MGLKVNFIENDTLLYMSDGLDVPCMSSIINLPDGTGSYRVIDIVYTYQDETTCEAVVSLYKR